jgi:hypothetical protein
MKQTAAIMLVSLSLLAPSQAALAKGCIKGAIVGGIAGHYAGHHGVLGAIGGCLYGRHLAHKNQQHYPDHHNGYGYGRSWL